jgi:hypothetical protein
MSTTTAHFSLTISEAGDDENDTRLANNANWVIVDEVLKDIIDRITALE